jgi:cell division protein FtsQ
MDYNPPNTRERVEARRQARRGQSAQAAPPRRTPPAAAPGQQAVPGARQALLGWVASGRLAGLLLFLPACLALGYLLTSPEFAVRDVRVEGNSALPNSEVAELAGFVGRPIWYVSPAEAVARLGESAYVASASVELALPDQALIRIVERRPEVRWQAGGVQYLVDGTGKVLGAAQEPAETDVLVIADNSHLELKPNEQLDTDAIRLAQDLSLRLPLELGLSPAQIGWDFGLGVYARTAAGQTIVFGQSEELARKLAVLDALLKDQTAFTYLDLRPDNPFYQNAAPTTPQPPAP